MTTAAAKQYVLVSESLKNNLPFGSVLQANPLQLRCYPFATTQGTLLLDSWRGRGGGGTAGAALRKLTYLSH